MPPKKRVVLTCKAKNDFAAINSTVYDDFLRLCAGLDEGDVVSLIKRGFAVEDIIYIEKDDMFFITTPLLLAIDANNIPLVQDLIENGVKINRGFYYDEADGYKFIVPLEHSTSDNMEDCLTQRGCKKRLVDGYKLEGKLEEYVFDFSTSSGKKGDYSVCDWTLACKANKYEEQLTLSTFKYEDKKPNNSIQNPKTNTVKSSICVVQ